MNKQKWAFISIDSLILVAQILNKYLLNQNLTFIIRYDVFYRDLSNVANVLQRI